MKLFKNVKVSMNYINTDEAIEKLADCLYEDESLIAYYESARAFVAFTSKRIIFRKGTAENPKSTVYYSYRNISAYGVSKNRLVFSLVNAPEYCLFKLKIKPYVAENKENPQSEARYYDAVERANDLCRALGDLIW